MRRSLSRVLVRVDRLAARLDLLARKGCSVCLEDEQHPLIYWDSAPADAPRSRTCACGRTSEREHVVIRWKGQSA